ncbi:MAG: nitroreductase family protein [Bacteroidota bacterium]
MKTGIFQFDRKNDKEISALADEFFKVMESRRTVRDFSSEIPPKEAVLKCLAAASKAPSGANKQPWKFLLIENKNTRKIIRAEAEKREEKFYENKKAAGWHQDLEKLPVNYEKPFLEAAPYLIAIMKEKYGISNGQKTKHYFVNESVGIATGMLIAGLAHSGILSLTYTPSGGSFIESLLGRPDNESLFLILACGFPAHNASVPELCKKDENEYLEII